MRTIEVRVYGVVQGVFFRQSTQEKARELGLAGWVENLSDGSVRMRAAGFEEALDALTSWCWRGPERAHVERVEVADITHEQLPQPFEVRR